MPNDPIDVARILARVFDSLGIRYLIGGSVASTFHGEPRTTLDIDFAIRLEPAQAGALRAALGQDFYADEESLRDAAIHKRLVNVIHLPTMVKADLYVRPDEGLYAAELARAETVRVGSATLRIATPEDTLLQKLRWYEAGGRASDRQWRDVLGILKARGAALDLEYMERWAEALGLSSLLERAWREAGLGG